MSPKESAHIARLACGPWRSAVSAELVETFHRALQDQSIDDALEALSRCLKEPDRRFPVTPPEVIRTIKTIRGASAPTPPAVVSQSAPMLERFWRNGREYTRASRYARGVLAEWYKRAAREGAERRAAKRSAPVPDNSSDGGGSP